MYVEGKNYFKYTVWLIININGFYITLFPWSPPKRQLLLTISIFGYIHSKLHVDTLSYLLT